jgi:hypothetical protein
VLPEKGVLTLVDLVVPEQYFRSAIPVGVGEDLLLFSHGDNYLPSR